MVTGNKLDVKYKRIVVFLKEDRGLQARALFDYQASMLTWCYSKYSWLKWSLLFHFLWLGHSQLERNISVLHTPCITFRIDLWKCLRLIIVLLLLHVTTSLQIISMECFLAWYRLGRESTERALAKERIDWCFRESACDQNNENCQLNNYMFSYKGLSNSSLSSH